MQPLWQHYVFERGQGLYNTWDLLFESRPIRLLYIAGRGFDVRAQYVMQAFADNIRQSRPFVEKAELLLVGFSRYEMSDDLKDETERNANALENIFEDLGSMQTVSISSSAAGEDDLSASNALRLGVDNVLQHINNQTDIVLDASSLPRVVYLALMTGILDRLIQDKKAVNPLFAEGVNFQVLVAEDAALDSQIRSEDPSNDLILVPGFSSALHAESFQHWPLVWFPILGENRVSQFQKVLILAEIPKEAEICPVLPCPSRDPRRADRLLVEYKASLFDTRETATANILYSHETNPFAAYRQMLLAMRRYRESMSIIGGCRLVVTPLGSKLITLGAGLACFEMRPTDMDQNYCVAIPYAEASRYVVSLETLHSSRPEVSGLLLTGDAYKDG